MLAPVDVQSQSAHIRNGRQHQCGIDLQSQSAETSATLGLVDVQSQSKVRMQLANSDTMLAPVDVQSRSESSATLALVDVQSQLAGCRLTLTLVDVGLQQMSLRAAHSRSG